MTSLERSLLQTLELTAREGEVLRFSSYMDWGRPKVRYEFPKGVMRVWCCPPGLMEDEDYAGVIASLRDEVEMLVWLSRRGGVVAGTVGKVRKIARRRLTG